MLKIGVIGFGGRIGSIVKLLVESNEVILTAVMDPRMEEVKQKAKDCGYEGVHFYDDADTMLQSEKLDGVLIGTRCNLHTHYAMLVSKYNLPLFLEKPVSITREELEQLKTILFMNEKTVVSFPLRASSVLLQVKEIVDSGKLGRIEHVEAYNNVPYGRGYYHKWYKDESITGGLWLQKATHDLDYICQLLGDNKPIQICAMNSKQIFKGDEPEGKKCKDCDKARECPESPQNVRKNGDGYIIGEYCCFAKDVGNEDSGSCIIRFESGMHAVYTQDFIVRNGAGKRGARLIGYKGTLEFDWLSGTIQVFHHLENITETIRFNTCGSHFGGDEKLVENFIDVMHGKAISHSTLKDGINSANLCLCAKESCLEHRFIDIVNV